MEHLLPIMPGATCPPADDRHLRRVLELLTGHCGFDWAVLEVSPADRGEPCRISHGTPGAEGQTLRLRCLPTFSVELRLPPGQLPAAIGAAAELLVDQALRVHQLRRQASLLRSAIDAAPDAILVFDLAGNILHANSAADHILSRQTEDGLAVVSSGGSAQPLVERLCGEVAEVADGSEEAEQRTILPLSDGSALACAVIRLAGAEGPSGVLVRLQALRSTVELALATFVDEHALSPREAEVVELLHQGHSTARIAEELAISPHTVRDHLKNLYRKTATKSRSELLGLLARHPA